MYRFRGFVAERNKPTLDWFGLREFDMIEYVLTIRKNFRGDLCVPVKPGCGKRGRAARGQTRLKSRRNTYSYSNINVILWIKCGKMSCDMNVEEKAGLIPNVAK